MQVGEYNLVNVEKVNRALNGTQRADGSSIGGVGEGAYREGAVWMRDGEELSEKESAALDFKVLAEYDKLAGLITRDGDHIKNGSFFDYKSKKPRVEPKISRVFRVNNKTVIVPDGEETPGIVKAAKILEAEEKATKKAKKSSMKKSKKNEDADDSDGE